MWPLLLVLIAVGLMVSPGLSQPVPSLGWLTRLRPAVPWLGVAVAALGTQWAFSSSTVWVERGSLGVGLGFVFTGFLGVIGLAIVVWGLRSVGTFRMFFPLAAIAVGLLYLASFYAYLPPWSMDGPVPLGMVWMVAPGLALVGVGGAQWWRHGLTGRAEEAIWLGGVVGSRVVSGTLGLGLLAAGVVITAPPAPPPPHLELTSLIPRPHLHAVASATISARLLLDVGNGVDVSKVPVLTMDGSDVPASWDVDDDGAAGRVFTDSVVLVQGEHEFSVRYWDTTGVEFTHRWRVNGTAPYPAGPPPTPTP